jgi:surface polysaccharide O-acyltransferase-like enzyme
LKRIQSIDVFRLVAIAAVIAIHTSPFELDDLGHNKTYQYLYITISQLTRFAVPFFFVISGYLWGTKARNESNLIPYSLKMARRIVVIYLVWSCIYLLPYQNIAAAFDYGLLGPLKVAYWKLGSQMQHPLTLFMQGTRTHLWFLIGLLFSLAISATFIHRKWITGLIVLSIILYIIGVLGRAYVDTPIGIDIDFNTRNGPFFGTLFFATGYFMSGHTTNPRWLLYGSLLFIFGLLIHSSEILFLWKVFDTSPIQDYVIGTYFMGTGVAMAALSNHPVLQSNLLGRVGQMTLGLYAIHYIYVDLFVLFDKNVNTPLWEVGYVILVLLLSVISVIILSKNTLTRKIV